MSLTAEELLNSLSEDEIQAYLADAAEEPHIVIGKDRFITVPDELKRIAVQFDHNIETVTFDCPRYWDGHDLSKMKLYVNYAREDGYKDAFPCENVKVDENDNQMFHFTWTITNNVTVIKGEIAFLVCAKVTDEEGNEKNHWNSEANKEMYVSEGLECQESIFESNPDLVTFLLTRVDLLNQWTDMEFEDDGEGNVTLHGVSNPGNLAPIYDMQETYSVGDYCLYLGKMFKCVTAVEIPELWDAEKWVPVSVTDELKECFQDVADGKKLVASAITDMKVETDATATFEEMAANIRSIKTGQGDAQPEDVTEGKTFTNDSGDLLTGTNTVVADLAALQEAYNKLSEESVALKAEHDQLVVSYQDLQDNYDMYKYAVVDGLANSGLGVTLETSAEDLKTILLTEYPAVVYIYDENGLMDGVTWNGSSDWNGVTRAATSGEDGEATVIHTSSAIDASNFNTLLWEGIIERVQTYGDNVAKIYGGSSAGASDYFTHTLIGSFPAVPFSKEIDISHVTGDLYLTVYTHVTSGTDNSENTTVTTSIIKLT